MSIGGRLFRILQALAKDNDFAMSRYFNKGEVFLNSKIKEWKSKAGSRSGNERRANQTKTRSEPEQSLYSKQFIEDLKIFNLEPPSSWTEVKESRKREMKKFHPDRFVNDPDNMETAKQITQIYNAAFERLKREFKDKSDVR